MALTPPYEKLVTRLVLMHDPNPDVTPTHPPAIFRDQVAHLALSRGMPHSCGFRCLCPPTPGITRSPTGSVLPDNPSWQPFVLLGAVRRRGIAAWNPWSSCASARPTVSLPRLVPTPSPCGDPHRDQASPNMPQMAPPCWICGPVHYPGHDRNCFDESAIIRAGRF